MDENSDIDDDVLDDSISMTSNTSSILTKRLPITKQVSKKKSIQEDEILKKAIVCLDKVTNEEPEDGLTIFARYIASELREIQYPHLQRWAKLQIQQIIFSVQNSNTQHSNYYLQQSEISQSHSQEDFKTIFNSLHHPIENYTLNRLNITIIHLMNLLITILITNTKTVLYGILKYL